MFGRIVLFELRYQIRQPVLYISFVVLAALGFAAEIAEAKFGSAVMQANSPYLIAMTFCVIGIFGLPVPMALLAGVALRDAETGMD